MGNERKDLRKQFAAIGAYKIELTTEEESKRSRIQPKLSNALQNTNNRALYYRAILDVVVKMDRDKTALKLTHEQNVMAKRAISKLKPIEYISTVKNWYKTNGLEDKLTALVTELGDLSSLEDVAPVLKYNTCINCGRFEWMLDTFVECRYCRRNYEAERKSKQHYRRSNSYYRSPEESSYSKYGGYNGYDDDTIDSAFEGDPELTWNID